MKTIIISNSDYKTLKSLITGYPSHLKTKEMGKLLVELEKADKVEDQKIGNDVIRLNSRFKVEDVAGKKTWELTLTLPKEANLEKLKLSVFSPMGVALIGYREGMTIQWELPGGLKTLKILKVANS